MQSLILFTFLVKATFAGNIHSKGREIVGGDIVHSGESTDWDVDVSVFRARQSAIKKIIEECGGVHTNIIPRETKTVSLNGQHFTEAKVSISYEDCKASKSAPQNQEILKAQKLYNQILLGKIKPEDEEVIDMAKKAARNEQSYLRQMISAMQNEISDLKRKITEVRVVAPARLPATNAMKEMCFQEYKDLMNEAMANAPDGNLAGEDAVYYYNKAQRKLNQCRRLQ